MSIWASLDQVPAYSVDYQPSAEHPPGCEVDVATAASWNDCVRLVMWEASGMDASVMLDPDGVDHLILLLTEARDRIARNHPSTDSG